MEIVHLKHHDNGMISFNREITWLGNIKTGWGNGYVGVPERHPLFGKDYNDINIDIHGGLTYADEDLIENKTYWIFGFDCAHSFDNPITSNEAYVIAETENLFNQISNYLT